MTIITQPITEKKLAKQQEPLVKAEDGVAAGDVEEGSPVVVTMRAHARRVSSTTTLCVFVTALLVLTTGIIGGVYLYRQFSQYKLRHFRGWCSVPYPVDRQHAYKSEHVQKGTPALPSSENLMWEHVEPQNGVSNYFDEEFDIDIEFEHYERIEVPDFSHGRRGRFVHDFTLNKTGIVDIDGRRCFVMPLNRSLVLPPHSLFDLVVKMRAGYYEVDTDVVREKMRVVTPPITDLKSVGYYIARDCATLPTYRLEPITSPVYKRSVENVERVQFVEFAGVKISEIDIVNLKDIEEKKE